MSLGRARLLRGGAGVADLPPGPWRAVHAWRGGLEIAATDGAAHGVRPGTGHAIGRGACRIRGDAPESAYFLWEIHSARERDSAVPDGLRELEHYDMPSWPGRSPGQSSGAVLRFERVDLHDGVETPRHTHLGSGLRVLIDGALQADIGGTRLDLHPGDTWLEKGPGEPVVGRTTQGCRTAFVRLLVLPPDALGQDSFVSLEDDDRPRPRPAAYVRFHEEKVAL